MAQRTGGATDARRARPGLTPDDFDRLLAALDASRERAGIQYEAIRVRLLRFFLCRSAPRPEELADETIDRVCRKLAQGEVIRSADVGRYFLGVARNVAREAWDLERRQRESRSLDAIRQMQTPAGPAEDDTAGCLDRCLAAMAPESRDLLLRYYDNDPPEKIARRRALAEALGVKPNALRIRLYRLRAQLEGCLRRCRQARDETISPRDPLQKGGGAR